MLDKITFAAFILSVYSLLCLTGCGVSAGNFRMGTPEYLRQLRGLEQPGVYDSWGRFTPQVQQVNRRSKMEVAS